MRNRERVLQKIKRGNEKCVWFFYVYKANKKIKQTAYKKILQKNNIQEIECGNADKLVKRRLKKTFKLPEDLKLPYNLHS